MKASGEKNSYDDFGIIISKRHSIPSHKRRITYIDIPDKSSNLKFDEGTFESEPVIKFYGSGDIKLKINEYEVIVKKVDEYVTIDSALKDAYKEDVLKNGDMIGQFPILKVGENVVSFSGNVSKVEVKVMRFGYRNINKSKNTFI